MKQLTQRQQDTILSFIKSVYDYDTSEEGELVYQDGDIWECQFFSYAEGFFASFPTRHHVRVVDGMLYQRLYHDNGSWGVTGYKCLP